jgi:putative endonuclease
MTNRRNGTLYCGVTTNLPRLYYEHHDSIRNAIQREKNIKHWPRAWKVRLIHAMNPEWEDLYDTLI